MKKQILFILAVVSFLFTDSLYSQEKTKSSEPKKVSKLFRTQDPLSIKLNYSSKLLRKETNDSTYMDSELAYQKKDGEWEALNIEIRSRGNFRKNNCYYTPLKLKIKKSIAKETVFKGNKRLKLVLPCDSDKRGNDYVVKELMAYRLYDIISDFTFKTRLTKVDFNEIKGKKTKNHLLTGFLIEDDSKMADRCRAKLLKRPTIHPLEQDPIECIKHAMFQFMIGNTDFSTAYQHNAKLLYKDKKMFPVPYDFDLSGLVNPSYAYLSEVHLKRMKISSVIERKYRGFKRDQTAFNEVKEFYFQKKDSVIKLIDDMEPLFRDPDEFNRTKNYILDFYKIIENEASFHKQIVSQAREQ